MARCDRSKDRLYRTRFTLGKRPLRESPLKTARYFLNGEIYSSMKKLRVLAERWWVHYNTIRPHSSLGYVPPAPAVWITEASQGHGKVESKERFPLFHTPTASRNIIPSLYYTNNLAGTKDRASHFFASTPAR